MLGMMSAKTKVIKKNDYNNKYPIIYREFQGNFIKPCPGTKEDYICCGYYVLNYALNCNLQCDYCILQAYLNSNELTVFSNWKAIYQELRNVNRNKEGKKYRIGTGELTDSLLLDPITKFSQNFVPFVATLPNIVLELKTKTTNIKFLEGLEHRKKTIAAWSLAPDKLIKIHEKRSPSLDARLKAAEIAASWGYPLAFHFDPIIRYSSWQIDYENAVKKLANITDAENIAWISLGAFRYTTQLGRIISKDVSKRRLLMDEFVFCPDGKFRYFWSIRAEMIGTIASALKKYLPGVFLYLCMESPRVWQSALGWVPESRETLSNLLDIQAFRFNKGNGV